VGGARRQARVERQARDTGLGALAPLIEHDEAVLGQHEARQRRPAAEAQSGVEPALRRMQRAVLTPDAPGLIGVLAQGFAVDLGGDLGHVAVRGELAQPRGDPRVAVARPKGEVLAQLDGPPVVARDAPADATGRRDGG
jgi:hypothetical protein